MSKASAVKVDFRRVIGPTRALRLTGLRSELSEVLDLEASVSVVGCPSRPTMPKIFGAFFEIESESAGVRCGAVRIPTQFSEAGWGLDARRSGETLSSDASSRI